MNTETLVEPLSLWRHTALAEPQCVPYSGHSKTDTVIIGAGFTGLRAAVELASLGLKVVVLEQGNIGWGASGRSGGQVNPILRLQYDQIAARTDPESAERFVKAVIGSADEVFSLIGKHQIDCQPVQKGWLQAAHCESAAASLTALAEDWRLFGANIEVLDDKTLLARAGTSYYSMGLFHPNAGHLHPMSYVRGLAIAAMNANAKVHTFSRVQALECRDGKWVVAVNGGEIRADTVLICTNGYTQGLNTALDKSYLPFTPIQLATDVLPNEIFKQILPENTTIADTRRRIFYGRKTSDRRLIFGGLGKGVNHGDDYTRIRNEAQRIFPVLRNVAWEFQWGGNIAMTMDSLPHIHDLAPGLSAALGCNGRGVAMSTVIGRVLSEHVVNPGATTDVPVMAVPRIAFSKLKSIVAPLSLPFLGWLDGRDK